MMPSPSASLNRKERCLVSEVVYLREMLGALMEEKNDVGRLQQQLRDAEEVIITYEATLKSLMQEVLELRSQKANNQEVISMRAQLMAAESQRIKEVTRLQNIIHDKDKEIAALRADLLKGGK